MAGNKRKVTLYLDEDVLRAARVRAARIRSEGVVRADPLPSPEPLSADPDDEYLIDLARDAGADAIVTGDAHLLDLRAIIPAMTPAEFLELLTDH